MLGRNGNRWEEVRFIRSLHWGQRAYIVCTDEGWSQEIKIGVRQPCVLFPSVSNFCTKQAFGAIKDIQGVYFGGVNINLSNTDDRVLIATSKKSMKYYRA